MVADKAIAEVFRASVSAPFAATSMPSGAVTASVYGVLKRGSSKEREHAAGVDRLRSA
jgi:hypothetical protein